MNEQELALEIGRHAAALNEALGQAWRFGLKVELHSVGGHRTTGLHGLCQVDVRVLRPLDTEQVTEEDRGNPRAAITRAIGGGG